MYTGSTILTISQDGALFIAHQNGYAVIVLPTAEVQFVAFLFGAYTFKIAPAGYMNPFS